MNTSFSLLLILSFVVSLIALAAMVWAITQGNFFGGKKAALSIFEEGESEVFDDPSSFYDASSHKFDALRAGIDKSGRPVVLVMLSVAMVFLLVGSIYGLISSFKLHLPDWLSQYEFLTFGRARTVHLNLVNYG